MNDNESSWSAFTLHCFSHKPTLTLASLHSKCSSDPFYSFHADVKSNSWSGLRLIRGRALVGGPKITGIAEVATHPDHRRTGSASRLLAQELNESDVYVLHASDPSARIVYAKAGFGSAERIVFRSVGVRGSGGVNWGAHEGKEDGSSRASAANRLAHQGGDDGSSRGNIGIETGKSRLDRVLNQVANKGLFDGGLATDKRKEDRELNEVARDIESDESSQLSLAKNRGLNQVAQGKKSAGSSRLSNVLMEKSSEDCELSQAPRKMELEERREHDGLSRLSIIKGMAGLIEEGSREGRSLSLLLNGGELRMDDSGEGNGLSRSKLVPLNEKGDKKDLEKARKVNHSLSMLSNPDSGEVRKAARLNTEHSASLVNEFLVVRWNTETMEDARRLYKQYPVPGTVDRECHDEYWNRWVKWKWTSKAEASVIFYAIEKGKIDRMAYAYFSLFKTEQAESVIKIDEFAGPFNEVGARALQAMCVAAKERFGMVELMISDGLRGLFSKDAFLRAGFSVGSNVRFVDDGWMFRAGPNGLQCPIRGVFYETDSF